MPLSPPFSQQISKHKFQDSIGNDLLVEVHHDDRSLGSSLSLQANSTAGATTGDEIAVDSVNRLPVEMLSEVFLVCAHTLDKSEVIKLDNLSIPLPSHHYRLMLARNAVPYTVSSVCKRWRSIGLSTPKLWSQFTVPCSGYELEKFMVALRTWLKRSKNHPLEFTCLSGDEEEEEVLAELFKNIHRWRIVYFWNIHTSYLARRKNWFGNDGLKAENLDTLDLSQCNVSLNIDFHRFPNLRRLRIHPHCLAAEEVRGLSLTHLTLTNLEGTTATFFSYLRQFPSLLSFEAPVAELWHHLNHAPLTTFTHTTLTELTIAEFGGSVVLLRGILDNVHFPSIRRLCLKYENDGALSQTGEMANVVHDFIHRHESTFTDLGLSNVPISSDKTMMEIFHMFPKYLTSYQSGLDGLTDKCIKRLTLDSSDPSQDLAPDLSSISLNVYGDGDYPSGDLLAEMILSRWARNPPTTFKLWLRYTGLNPLSDSRIARRMRYSPGLLEFIGQSR